MEALKASLRSEASPPGQLQLLSGEEAGWAVERGNLLGEGFSVDDLLDLGEFAEGDAEEAGSESGPEPETRQKGTENYSSSDSSPSSLSSSLTRELQAAVAPPLSDICLPARDAVEELEWMSLIMDDSISEFPPPCAGVSAFSPPPGDAQEENRQAGAVVEGPSLGLTVCALSTEAMVPMKAKRSKRSRGVTASWSISGPLHFADSSCSSASSCASTSSSSSFLIYDPSGAGGSVDQSRLLYDHLHTFPPPAKKQKPKKRGRKPKFPSSASGPNGERRCSHCGVQKTPQWRAGPLGAKTLCNACGVRFKSGRLLPEYRPACSPTFVSHMHSNSHRKVLEMRREKEATLHASASPPVASF
ncbi:GATA transcription factor 7-like [Curcuma longa]|uniref:GATA transcription factor 7-like n=1 Tax=Curcuma longa TaxID=136217 RepID=UPI003D9DEAEB